MEESGEGEVCMNVKHILSPLWKIDIWMMETGRADYRGNSRYQIHEGMTRRKTEVLKTVKERLQLQTAATRIHV
jgi:hypothetical protein